MPRLTLTEDNILELRCPLGKKLEVYRDEVCPGLELHVMRSGVQTYFAMHREATGSKTSSRLGSSDSMSLIQARKEAVLALAEKQKAAAKSGRVKTRATLAEVFALYIKAKNILPDNAKKYEQVLRTYGGPLWIQGIDSITAADVLKQRQHVAEGTLGAWHASHGAPVQATGGAGSANDLMEYGSMLLNWHLGPGARNPFKGIEPLPTPEASGQFVFEPGHFPAVWRFMSRCAADARTLFWVSLLTGARPKAVARMMWKRLDLEKGTYHLTNDKVECAGWKPATSPEWNYPLDTYTLELLREHRMFTDPDAVFVFESAQRKRTGQPISDRPLSTIYHELRQALALPEACTPYAGRYTRATYSEVLFGDTILTQRMLNHQSDWGQGASVRGKKLGATPGYIRTAALTELVRSKVQTYADAIMELCEQKQMTEQTRRMFLANEALTIYERHELVLQATPEALLQVLEPTK